MHKNRIRSRVQPACEILNALLSIAILMIAYKTIGLQHPKTIATLCLIYSLFWSVIAYYDDYAWKPLCANIHQEARRNSINGSPYDFDAVQKSAVKQYAVLLISLVLGGAPLVYAYARVWWVYP